jgi:hypothetical protein
MYGDAELLTVQWLEPCKYLSLYDFLLFIRYRIVIGLEIVFCFQSLHEVHRINT